MVVVVCPPSFPSIWILACRTRSRLSASPVVEIYGRGFQHSAVFEIALPCVSPPRSLLLLQDLSSPSSLLSVRPLAHREGKKKRKEIPPKSRPPLPPLTSVGFCHQRGTVKIKKMAGSHGFLRLSGACLTLYFWIMQEAMMGKLNVTTAIKTEQLIHSYGLVFALLVETPPPIVAGPLPLI